jgi:hypothetical protein
MKCQAALIGKSSLLRIADKPKGRHCREWRFSYQRLPHFQVTPSRANELMTLASQKRAVPVCH